MQRRIWKRKSTRAVLEARANGRTFPAQLCDVSYSGCQIDCSHLDLCESDKIVLKFADQIKISGKIVWRHKGSAGVEFASPLPDAIARHLRFEDASAGDSRSRRQY